jgi:hypothetical protein
MSAGASERVRGPSFSNPLNHGPTNTSGYASRNKVAHVPRVLDVVKGQTCYIIGTVYMVMPLKANVLEDIAQDVRVLSLSISGAAY